MPGYTTTTLDQFASQLGTNLDDTSSLYWTVPEKVLAIQEGLRVWGALTSYWRTRGVFPSAITWGEAGITWNGPGIRWDTNPPYYDLSATMPTLRTRNWTLDQLTKEIQFACFEAANGISGTGMSGQISVQDILQCIQRARNRFVLDTRLPLSVTYSGVNPPPPQGLVQVDQASVYVHRAAWMDSMPGGYWGTWRNLWREDAWAVDHGTPDWTITPGMPQQYSEAELAPLQLQLSPPPSNAGLLEILSVNSLTMDLTDPDQTFGIPDEWIHAVKYAALADIFGPSSQIADPFRAQYCATRYTQAVSFAKNARSLLRVMVNGVPMPIDTLTAMDAGNSYWRNQTGPPQMAGVAYDLMALSTIATGSWSISCDVAQSAPIPTVGSQFIPLGEEDLPALLSYCENILMIKCGGKELQATMPNYDDFMQAASQRMGINKAKIRYLEPLFGMPNREWAQRPDMLEAKSA